MSVSAHDVARELRHRRPDIGVVKLHKLLYYCQGWHLGWTGRPMFPERIEGWANGPVVADLWHAEDKNYDLPPPRSLSEEMLTTVNFVVSRYARLSGRELIAMTHGEEPWRLATDNGLRLNAELEPEVLGAYFAADEEQTETRAFAKYLGERSDFQRIIDAVSKPKSTPVHDDTADLQSLLEAL